MLFGCQSSILQTSVDIHEDIQAGILQSISAWNKNIHEWVSIFCGYQCMIDITHRYPKKLIYVLIDIYQDIHRFLLISMHGLAMDSRTRDSETIFR